MLLVCHVWNRYNMKIDEEFIDTIDIQGTKGTYNKTKESWKILNFFLRNEILYLFWIFKKFSPALLRNVWQNMYIFTLYNVSFKGIHDDLIYVHLVKDCHSQAN